MSVTMVCRFPTPCWYARNVQSIVRNNTSNAGSIVLDQTENTFETKLRQRQEINTTVEELIQEAPPLAPSLEKTPYGRIYNLVTESPELFTKGASIAFGNELLLKLAAKTFN